jgi:hypothetical protein
MICTCLPEVLFTGTRTPRFPRMCCLWLMVTCICGRMSQSVLAPVAKSRHPRNSTIGDQRRPNP